MDKYILGINLFPFLTKNDFCLKHWLKANYYFKHFEGDLTKGCYHCIVYHLILKRLAQKSLSIELLIPRLFSILIAKLE